MVVAGFAAGRSSSDRKKEIAANSCFLGDAA
jgi:hypothetical protein